MIEIRDLHHAIGPRPILSGIDLTIPPGGVTALIGPNGAGKSTLLSLIARLQPIRRGTITVAGLEVGRSRDRDLAKVLAVMPQNDRITARLSVRDLVGFGRYPWHRGRPTADDAARVEAALERFGLSPLADRFLDAISGGQRQKALAAMAFVQDTPVLLLDEPLNNLDIAAARDLMRLTREMADRDGRTVLIVLHDINVATAFADRLIAMKDGRIVADGSPGEVVTPDLLRDTFGTDARIARVEGRPVVLA